MVFQKGHKKLGGRKPGISCSDETKKKISNALKGHTRSQGEKNSMYGKRPWNKKDIKRVEYVKILMPEHPFCDKYGYVKEHRLVMEKHVAT